jgi:hypothetical protein
MERKKLLSLFTAAVCWLHVRLVALSQCRNESGDQQLNTVVKWMMAAALIGASSAASAATDTYYVETGAYPSIGDISASGFFQTSGAGTDTVTGFDITLMNGTRSVTLCTSGAFGCAVNDTLSGQNWILDNGSKLICEAPCLLEDRGTASGPRSSFIYNVTALGDGEVGYFIGGPPSDAAGIGVGPASFVIAGAAPVPLPASAWLMLSGVVGLGALVRKRRTA